MKNFLILDHKSKIWSNSYKNLPHKEKDFYYSPIFAKFSQENIYNRFKVRCFFASDNIDFILCPFVLRKYRFENEVFCDLTSLYNHAGPIINNPKNLSLKKYFQKEILKYCDEKKIKNFFIRYHPKIGFKIIDKKNCQNIITGDFVHVDLKKIDKNNIIKNFSRAHKKSLKKAKDNNIKILASNDQTYISEFYNLYLEEMKKKKAEKFYHFNKNLFYNIKELKNNYQFFYAFYNKKIVSCELVLFSSNFSHSFLGATNSAYKQYCPNHLLKLSIISYFKEKNLKYYFIGGGSEGILKYKEGFKNINNLKNYIGILNFDKKYNQTLLNKIKLKYNLHNINKIQFYDNYL